MPERERESEPAPPAFEEAPENSRATFPRCVCENGHRPGWPTGSPEASPRHPHRAEAGRNLTTAWLGWFQRRVSSLEPGRKTGFLAPGRWRSDEYDQRLPPPEHSREWGW